jgi:hypothetical protein
MICKQNDNKQIMVICQDGKQSISDVQGKILVRPGVIPRSLNIVTEDRHVPITFQLVRSK